jgi:hypothetical protein
MPDGKLSYLPFEILLTENQNNKAAGDYQQLDYFIKKYNVSYDYSASILFDQNFSDNVSAHKNSIVAFAPEYQKTLDKNTE